MTTLYLVRHGQSESNEQGICTGQADFPLTELGRKQARKAAEYLANERIDAAYASNLSRALETAEIIALPHGIAVVPVPELREMNCGEWEAKTYTDIAKLFPSEFAVWQTKLDMARPHGGENPYELYGRVSKKLTEIAQRHDGQTVLVVTHALVMRTFVCMTAYGSLDSLTDLKWVPNASVTQAIYNGGKFSLGFVGYDGYLDKLSTTLKGL